MLPRIRRIARYAFRHSHPAKREDFVAEVVANVYCAFHRLVTRGQADLAYPTILGWFAVRQVREGRLVGSHLNVRDVMSPYGQRRKGFSVQPLPEASENDDWQELVVEDRHASPAEVATFKIDFADWLKQLKRSKRQLAVRLAIGETTGDAALRFRLTSSRISQLRKELHQNWDEFQGELESSAELSSA